MKTNTLLMKIEDVFTISGTGEVITGILDAPASTGDMVIINGSTYELGKIVMQRKLLTSAPEGSDVGIHIVNATRDAIGIGDFVYLVSED